MYPVKQRREAKGWTQGQLARRVGVTPSTVSCWEVRGSLPHVESLRKLAKIFEVDYLDLAAEIMDWQSAQRRS